MLVNMLSILLSSLLFLPSCSANFGAHPNSFSKRADTSKLPSWSRRNLNTIQRIYNLTVYPNNVPIVTRGASAVPAGLFNANARGRVSPVGNFSGFDDSIEYFFALAPTPNPQQNNVVIYSADVVAFQSGCPNVASSVVYLRTGVYDAATKSIDTTKQLSTLSQVAFWRFDSKGAVLDYQAWIPNLQAWTQAAVGVDFGSPIVQTLTPAQLCPVIQSRCTGANRQYLNTLACVLQLETKPFGSFDEAWGDNLACRAIHIILTQVRPEVHCPHVGPNGGNGPDNYKCVDIDYSREYFDDAQLFGSDMRFMC